MRIKPFAEIEAGHFLSIRFKKIMFDERNVHGQCHNCNSTDRYGKRGNPDAYHMFMIMTYGQRVVDELEFKKKQFAQFKSEDFKEIGEKYKLKIINIMDE